MELKNGFKWVFNTKYTEKGDVEKYKAMILAK